MKKMFVSTLAMMFVAGFSAIALAAAGTPAEVETCQYPSHGLRKAHGVEV